MPRLQVATESNGVPVEIHYEDRAEGRPVVLIHGWPLSGRAWEHQVSALIEAGLRVITYDRRGFGASSQPWEGYEYDTLADDLNQLLEHLDLRDVALVGFSMGGGEVVRFLSRHGASRISCAVLAGAVTPFLQKTADNPDGAIDEAGIAGLESGVRADRAAFLDSFTVGFFGAGDRTDLISEQERRYARTMAEFASPKGTLDCIRAFCGTDFRGEVSALTMPLLVLHGDTDGIVPFEASGRRMHELVPGSELKPIQGAPHGFHATHADDFNGALLEFLART